MHLVILISNRKCIQIGIYCAFHIKVHKKGSINMQAVLLNSGRGTRMKEHTENNHKSMIEIKEGIPLIVHQIQTLASCGIKDFVITTGYMAEKLCTCIKSHFGTQYHFTFVHNEKYEETNYIYSLFLAKTFIEGDCLLLHGDLYFTYDIIKDMQKMKESCVVVDTTLENPKKDFKARVDCNKVAQIGVYVEGESCYACQPLYKLKKEALDSWMEEIHQFCTTGNTAVYAEEALNNRLKSIKLYPYDLNGRLCMEVDTIEDLHILQNKIFKGSEMG